MDFLIEFIVELLLEGSIELGTNKKVPKIIRYPMLFFITTILLLVILLILYLGIRIWSQNKYASIFIMVIGIFFLIGFILKFKHIYNQKRKK